jgi:hypothetical protein
MMDTAVPTKGWKEVYAKHGFTLIEDAHQIVDDGSV